jgi:hypothetical protein
MIITNDMPYSMRIPFVLFCLALMLNAWRRWMKYVVRNSSESAPRAATPKWPLRPSNLLMILGMGTYIYCGLTDDDTVARFLFFVFSWIMIGGAFVLRYWEDEFTKE